MQIDYAKLTTHERYKLLVSTVVPRPIALATTVDLQGVVNAAPFSFFNAVCDEPAAVMMCVNAVPGALKDTARNIRDTGEFVVNLVDEAIASAMNICAVDFPPEVDELKEAGLTAAPSVKVRPPRIVESPVSFECRRLANLELGIGRNLVVGEVLTAHIRDELIDAEKLRVHTEKMRLIGRMHGTGWYARTTDLFEMPRLSLDEFRQMKAAAED